MIELVQNFRTLDVLAMLENDPRKIMGVSVLTPGVAHPPARATTMPPEPVGAEEVTSRSSSCEYGFYCCGHIAAVSWLSAASACTNTQLIAFLQTQPLCIGEDSQVTRNH